MKIYRDGNMIVDVVLDEKSSHKQMVTGENVIDIKFNIHYYIDLKINDYIVWEGEKFTAFNMPQWTKKSENSFEYSLSFESEKYSLRRIAFLMEGNTEFDLFGDANAFVDLLIANAKRIDDSWTKGIVVDTELKNISFSDEDCLTAITRACQELEVELDIDSKLVNVRNRIGVETGLTLGYKKGFTEINISANNNDSDIITRLYPFGGNINIPPNYGGARIKIDAIENNIETYGICEGVKVFENIYPHFEGSIDSVSDDLHFIDASINFDINQQLVPGLKATISVLSGDLAGYEFEIPSFDNALKKVEIIETTDENGNVFPNSFQKLRIGDKYTFINILMPDAYIQDAEAKLLTKATEHLAKVSTPKLAFSVKVDERYLKATSIILKCGDEIIIQEQNNNINQTVRIIGFERVLVNTNKYNLYLADEVVMDKFIQMRMGQYDINKSLAALRKELRILKQE